MSETIKPEIVAKAFFRDVQVGVLVKYAGTWHYYGMVPFMDDHRTQKIIQKEKVVI